jgi:predicted deacylase
VNDCATSNSDANITNAANGKISHGYVEATIHRITPGLKPGAKVTRGALLANITRGLTVRRRIKVAAPIAGEGTTETFQPAARNNDEPHPRRDI